MQSFFASPGRWSLCLPFEASANITKVVITLDQSRSTPD
jgi:hypothetical protein